MRMIDEEWQINWDWKSYDKDNNITINRCANFSLLSECVTFGRGGSGEGAK